MELMLEVISRQKFSLAQAGVQHVFNEVGGYIGRGDECEWVLPDKAKQISRKHVLISFEQGTFMLEDVSANGTFSLLGNERLFKHRKYAVEHGSSYRLGEYTVQARLLHKPNSYLAADMSTADALIQDDNKLDTDPLVALTQEDEFSARRRLGMYNDLLGQQVSKPAFQADHTEAPLSTMPQVSMIPEDWAEPSADTEQPYDAVEPDSSAITAVPLDLIAPRPSETASPQRLTPERAPNDGAPELEAFFKALGYETAPESPQERQRMLLQAAELLQASVEGMMHSLRNRADSKNHLRLPVTTMALAGNNPLKCSPTPKIAMDYLLNPPTDGMLPPVQAMLSGFDDLHSHHMGLMAGARAAVLAVLERLSPNAVEAAVDTAGPVRFRRVAHLWNAFTRIHRNLREDNNSFAAFFLNDFARAYDLQVRTLGSTSRHQKEK